VEDLSTTNISNDNFDKAVLKSQLPVLVEFWADWCNYCRTMSPVVQELADELDGKLEICRLNVDKQGDIAIIYGVKILPTFALFKNGTQVDRISGSCTQEELKCFLKNYVDI